MTGPLPMTAGRRVALIVGTPLALLLIGWTALTAVAWAGQGSYRVNLAIPVRGRLASVSVDSGQLSLGPGASGKLRVTGTAHYALARSVVTWQSTSSAVSVSSRCRQLTGPCSFAYAVTIPPRITARIDDSSGDVTARGLAGRLTLQAGSGNVRLSLLSGDVEIKDDSGDITGDSLSSPALILAAGSGNIDVTGLVSREVNVASQSGDTTLTFARVPESVQVSNDSGNVTLVLPPGGTAYRVEARTSSGATVVHVPTASSSPHVISVTDESGDITIIQATITR